MQCRETFWKYPREQIQNNITMYVLIINFFFYQISQKYIYRSSTILFLFNIFKVWKYNTLIKNKYIDLVIPNIVFLLKWVLDMYSYQFLKIIRSYWHYQITVDWISSCIRCCGWNIFLIILATFIPE